MSIRPCPSVYSVSSSSSRVQVDGASEPVVLFDMPDHLLKADVVAVVRHAMMAESVAGAADAQLVAKKLDWTMGNVKLPSWQVSGPANMAGTMLDISVSGPHGGIQQAIVYSMKEYTSAHSMVQGSSGRAPP